MRALAVGLAALAIGGCGASASVSGGAVFAEHCAVCHSISGSPSRAQQGGSLHALHLPRSELLQYTVEMPVIKRPLTRAQARAVVRYMQAIKRRR